MSDARQHEWRFYIDDMIGFAEKVIAYTDGLDQAGFVAGGGYTVPRPGRSGHRAEWGNRRHRVPRQQDR